MKQSGCYSLTRVFAAAIIAAVLFWFPGRTDALTLVHCENGLWGGTVIVDIIAKDPSEKKIDWMTYEELMEEIEKYSSHVSEEFLNQVKDWINSGAYGKKTFEYRSFKLDLDPITEVWLFPDDAYNFIEVDTDFLPYWDVPADSGTWSSMFSYVSPDLVPYPQGGVKFSTDGSGLLAPVFLELGRYSDPGGDYFSFESVLRESGYFTIGTELGGIPETSTHWDVFLYDSLTETYTFYDNSECIPEPCSIALLGLGALTLLRKRRA
ncbi:MAG: PEP-CTERM sorting domain-containing protein [Phycisphaerae bacterium]